MLPMATCTEKLSTESIRMTFLSPVLDLHVAIDGIKRNLVNLE